MMVVVFVLGIGLIGALSFFNINLNNQFEAKNELIAAGLAQEGADLVRNLRDYNLLVGNSWYNNLYSSPNAGSSLCDAVDYSSLDPNSARFHKCYNGAPSHDHICIGSDNLYYQCTNSDSAKTDFIRTVDITRNGNLDSGGYLEIVCTVSWNGRATTATDILYNNTF